MTKSWFWFVVKHHIRSKLFNCESKSTKSATLL